MRVSRTLLCLCLCLLLASVGFAQQADSDGDGVPDLLDYCPGEAGSADFNGCTSESFPDVDADGVADPVDSCMTEAGSPDNNGCPAEITPDFDMDGIPDADDACPREFGEGVDGCPPDADRDGVADFADACPDQAGTMENLGCPEGVAAPDADGDGVPDLYDACPDGAGVAELGGCPDADGDGVPDNYDTCPDQAGQQDLFGCVPMIETTLTTNRAPITAGNAAQVAELGRLVVGIPRVAVAGNGTLAVRAGTHLYTYDLPTETLTPLVDVETGWAGYPVAISGFGDYLATLEFSEDFSTPPYVQVRDGATGEPLFELTAPVDANNNPLGVGNFAFSPGDTALLGLAPTTGGMDFVRVDMPLYNVASNEIIAQFSHPSDVSNLAFSPDGSRMATDTFEGGTMAVFVWDPASQTQVTRIPTSEIRHFVGTPMAFNGDGSLLAIGYPDGSVHLWQAAAQPSESFNVQVFDAAASEVVSAIAYSPDGSVIAVAGGVPFSGGLTGEEVFAVVLLDAATGSELARWEAHDSLIRDLAFATDGSLLVSAADTTVRFWGVAQ